MAQFKRAGKQIFGVKFTPAEQKIVDAEIAKQLAEHTRRHNLEIVAMTLRVLRKEFGFGKERLYRFFVNYDNDVNELVERYMLDEEDCAWIATRELKEEGIDIEAWVREYEQERASRN